MKSRQFDVNNQDYLKVVLDERNIFSVKVSFEILGRNRLNEDAKIDTGCNYSSISASTIGFTKEDAQKQKEMDLKNGNVPRYGIRNAGTTELQRINDKIQRACGHEDRMKNVTFGHMARNITIEGIHIEDMEFKVSYDTEHPILIGMDVLKQFDIHIHKTADNRTIFLACPLYYISEKYKQEVIDLMNK